MSTGGHHHDIMMGNPTETVDQNSWELSDSRPKVEVPAWGRTSPSACG